MAYWCQFASLETQSGRKGANWQAKEYVLRDCGFVEPRENNGIFDWRFDSGRGGAVCEGRRTRSRSPFYPTVLIVVASYYILFAAMRADGHAIGVEIVACVVFSVVAIAGFKWNM